MDKFRADLHEHLDAVWDGASIAVGGFGSSGRPDALLNALCDLGKRDLHLYVNNVGDDFTGIGRLVMEGRVRRLTGSFPVLPEFYDEYFAGRVELELIPQGTLAERMRAGGAGIAAFYTPSGAGTMLSDGSFPLAYAAGSPDRFVPAKEERSFDGRPHVLEHGIRADFGLVKAQQADPKGNVRFHLSARNFNPLAAMSGRTTFVEVERLVGTGDLGPDDIHLPGVFVDHVVMTAAPIPADLPRRAAMTQDG
ncbi:3-oxoacid CoA-transferase subunit A [Citricoccus sp. SGAir0253]|uniref:CoA transferase subunit A n=1 Tax=Citricoccus sp. SGAir0253 TaxID=2567881 RepID=UPI0010CD0B42|nr:3-oxoacid CoA-transferase subunit A [Citricoccus sp. SGAir0253]QCU78888.1 3-oxoacid CoA-transferase subunit A [Citricoccus sp. SGAir0253]